jgi:hypothetical protein
MSGEDIPYQLRPNKFIDRQMFVDLLSRLVGPRGPEKYIYISMGGRHLVDHYAVYRELGIGTQFSFDQNENAVKRQKFNRPTDATVCEEMLSGDLPNKIDLIVGKFPKKTNVIVWFDYTSADRMVQLQETVELLTRLKHGDVFRVTMNAEKKTLNAQDWQVHAPTPGAFRANKLRQQVGDFLPTDISEIGEETFPFALARCVQLAAQKAVVRIPGLTFDPVLITSYADGARMLTVTCSVRELTSRERFPNGAFGRWRFACRGWSDINLISAPILSSRERYKLDSNLKKGGKRMHQSLRFMVAEDEEKSLAAVASYRKFHRYYPAFRHVDD